MLPFVHFTRGSEDLFFSPFVLMASKRAASDGAGSDVKRARRCGVCSSVVAEKGWRIHQQNCVAKVELCACPVPLLGLDDNRAAVQVLMSGMSSEVKVEMLQLCRTIKRAYDGVNAFCGCRPWHEGTQYCVGWSRRAGAWAGPQQCSQSVYLVARCFIRLVEQQELIVRFKRFAQRVNSGLDLPCAAELKEQGSTMMYYGLNYVPRRPGDAVSAVAGTSHPDPAQVLFRRQQGQACHLLCSDCSSVGCENCERCPLHKDDKDKGLTIALFWQEAHTPVQSRASFLLGDRAHPVQGGRCFVFAGKHMGHGMFVPATADSSRWPWHGLAIVCQ